MKKLLAILGLFLFMAIAPVKAEAAPQLKITAVDAEEYMSQQDFNKAVGLAVKHYGGLVKRMGLKFENIRPIHVYFAGGYYGIYLNNVAIVIHVDSIEKDSTKEEKAKRYIYVVAHELGHHILNEAGVSIDDQHKHMYCEVDPGLAEEIGFPINFLFAMMHCMGERD